MRSCSAKVGDLGVAQTIPDDALAVELPDLVGTFAWTVRHRADHDIDKGVFELLNKTERVLFVRDQLVDDGNASNIASLLLSSSGPLTGRRPRCCLCRASYCNIAVLAEQ